MVHLRLLLLLLLSIAAHAEPTDLSESSELSASSSELLEDSDQDQPKMAAKGNNDAMLPAGFVKTAIQGGLVPNIPDTNALSIRCKSWKRLAVSSVTAVLDSQQKATATKVTYWPETEKINFGNLISTAGVASNVQLVPVPQGAVADDLIQGSADYVLTDLLTGCTVAIEYTANTQTPKRFVHINPPKDFEVTSQDGAGPPKKRKLAGAELDQMKKSWAEGELVKVGAITAQGVTKANWFVFRPKDYDYYAMTAPNPYDNKPEPKAHDAFVYGQKGTDSVIQFWVCQLYRHDPFKKEVAAVKVDWCSTMLP
jgi:hypothetical protein